MANGIAECILRGGRVLPNEAQLRAIFIATSTS